MHFLGVAGMPRRVPDYPDAYFIFNKIASWGSYISAVSSIFFFYVVYNAFTKGRLYFNIIMKPISLQLIVLSV
jgi:cytochrome c oxidase subunit 1